MLEFIQSSIDLVLAWCRENPIYLFTAIAILPGVAFPVAPLLLLAGAVWGANPLSCLIALSAVCINITWTHWIATGPMRGILARFMGNRWQRWAEMPRDSHWKIACMLRITPGVPLFMQNYLIGLLGVPLIYSLALAIPITGGYVCGFVLTSGAIFEGRVGMLVLGLSLLAAASLFVHLLKKKLRPTPLPES